SKDNDELFYPKFRTLGFLSDATQDRFYSAQINVDRESTNSYWGRLYEGALPEGYELSPDDSNYRFVLQGSTSELGSYHFVLKIKEDDGTEDSDTFDPAENATYKQFRI